MRLLFVIDGLGSGGAQRQMVHLAQGLEHRGHRVVFAVYHPEYDYFAPALRSAGISVIALHKGRVLPFGFLKELSHQLGAGGYDIVLSFLDMPNLYAELVSVGRRPFKLVVSERNSYPDAGASLSKRLLEKFHALADHITVNTYYQADLMIRANPWMSTKLSVIYNGVDLRLFKPDLHNSSKPNTLLCVGSIIPRKNATGLARMLGEYSRAFGAPPHIDWVGSAYSTALSQDECRRVNQILADSGMAEHWSWLGECSEMEKLYHQYSVLIMPSRREGLSNAVCEAMASGLPILAGRIGEQPRFITDNVNGFLFEPNSPLEMAHAVHSFFSQDQTTRTRFGAASRAIAETEFGELTYFKKYEDLFHSLFSRK